jgi:hypothetical protein
LTRPPRIVAVATALVLVVLLAAPASADPDPPASAEARAAALRALLARHPAPVQPGDPVRRWLHAVLDALNGHPERIDAAIADALTSQITQAEAEAAGLARRLRGEGMTDKALTRTLVTLAWASERTADEATRRHLAVEAAQLQVVLARRRLIEAQAGYRAAQDEFARTGSGLARREAAAEVVDQAGAALAERETTLTEAIAARDGVRLRPASPVSAAIPVTMPAEVAALGLATAHRQALSEQEERLKAAGAKLLPPASGWPPPRGCACAPATTPEGSCGGPRPTTCGRGRGRTVSGPWPRCWSGWRPRPAPGSRHPAAQRTTTRSRPRWPR